MRVLLTPLSAMLLFPLLGYFLLLGGCGGAGVGETSEPDGLSPQARTVYLFLLGLADEDPATVLSVLEPGAVRDILQNLASASEEELASVIMKALRRRFPFSEIRETSFHVAEEEEGRATVRCWGTFELENGGHPETLVLEEGEAMTFEVVEIDGSWFLKP